MTIGGNARTRQDPLKSVNNGDSFVDQRWVTCPPLSPLHRLVTRLNVSGRVLNVQEHTQTVSYDTQAGRIFNVQRTITVTTSDNTPLHEVTQSDVVSALREYDAQTAAMRQQAQAHLQAQEAAARPDYPPPAGAAGAAARPDSPTPAGAAVPEAEQPMNPFQNIINQIKNESQPVLGTISKDDSIKLIRMRKGFEDQRYKERLLSMGAYPSPEDVVRLEDSLAIMLARERLLSAWDRSQAEDSEADKAMVLRVFLTAQLNALSASNSAVARKALNLLNGWRIRLFP